MGLRLTCFMRKGFRTYPACSPSPSGTDFDKQLCSLILIEVGFCADLSCHINREEKANKYAPLISKLKEEWGAVYLVCIPVGSAGTLHSLAHGN